MLLKPEEAWNRAMKAAAAFHELGMIQDEIDKTQSRIEEVDLELQDAIKEATGRVESNLDSCEIKIVYRTLAVSSEEEALQAQLFALKTQNLEQLKILRKLLEERKNFLKDKEDWFIRQNMLPSLLYLLLCRPSMIRK